MFDKAFSVLSCRKSNPIITFDRTLDILYQYENEWGLEFDEFLTLNCYKRNMPAASRSYLLRIWLESNSPTDCRFMLLDLSTSQRIGFGELNALFLHLAKETQQLEIEHHLEQRNEEGGFDLFNSNMG